LEDASGRTVELRNLGVNGYTTANLIDRELPEARPYAPDYVTVLIGVNDFVQGVSEDLYTVRLRAIYGAVQALGLPIVHIAVVSIPDFSYAPAAASFGGADAINTGLRRRNAIAVAEAAGMGWRFVDIFAVSRSGIGSHGWLAGDGLHPGDAQYAAWADHIWNEIGPDWTAGARPGAS
jgi:lysophospholipase L1-like esterase